jgi:hypothetical protein
MAEHGMRPVSQVAVDEEWSALRFQALREGEAPFTGGRDSSATDLAATL